jgi:hypothetical protein
MSTRERPIDRGHRLATADRMRIGQELRVARRVLGHSVHVVGSAAGMSGAHVARIERGVLPTVSIDQLARIGAAVGLDVRVRAYPGPDPTLDAGQIALSWGDSTRDSRSTLGFEPRFRYRPPETSVRGTP